MRLVLADLSYLDEQWETGEMIVALNADHQEIWLEMRVPGAHWWTSEFHLWLAALTSFIEDFPLAYRGPTIGYTDYNDDDSYQSVALTTDGNLMELAFPDRSLFLTLKQAVEWRDLFRDLAVADGAVKDDPEVRQTRQDMEDARIRFEQTWKQKVEQIMTDAVAPYRVEGIL